MTAEVSACKTAGIVMGSAPVEVNIVIVIIICIVIVIVNIVMGSAPTRVRLYGFSLSGVTERRPAFGGKRSDS